jgi:hypothetical protein
MGLATGDEEEAGNEGEEVEKVDAIGSELTSTPAA